MQQRGIMYLWPSNNQSPEKSKQTDKMMKTVLLLAFAVFVSGNPVKHVKTKLLEEFLEQLNTSLSRLPKGTDIYLKDLIEVKGLCPEHVFCQAEHELLKLSGLTKYEDFRVDGRLMRTLNEYNKHHNNTCEPGEGQEQILVHAFLVELKKCVHIAYSKPK